MRDFIRTSHTSLGERPKLRVICGPTAAGKSALAMLLARRFNATIISADSRQVYRGFDIGTGKPSLADRDKVPHRGVNVADPVERYSAARWAREAATWVAEARSHGSTPLVVGGTGFYIRALITPLFDEPELDPTRRQQLELYLGSLPTETLRHWCEHLDPARAHLGRAQLLRAIEVSMMTGRSISDWHSTSPRQASNYSAKYLLVDPGPALRRLVADRVQRFFAAGWGSEVESLLRNVPEDAPAWNATGYDLVRDWVRGLATRAEATDRITIRTRQYGKRQRTWFRHQIRGSLVTILDPSRENALERAVDWWEDTNDT
ncbi:MAG: tRNA (adenosine(37)-N6)-dimethylallyltransferase MiaA [Gemmatimonadaceae bacterium]